MIMPDVKTELPQASRKLLSKSRTDSKSVCPKDFGVDKHMAMSTKRTNNKLLHIETYNTQSLSTDEGLMELEGELEHIKWEVVGLSEVKRRGEQLIDLKSGHIFYNVGEEESSWGGIGFLIHKRHKHRVSEQNINTSYLFNSKTQYQIQY